MTNIEAMKLALDALEACEEDYIYDGEEEYECDKIDWEKRNKALAALRQAIENHSATIENHSQAISEAEQAEKPLYRKVLREMLDAHEQAEQEPVAWHAPDHYGVVTSQKKYGQENGWLPLYTAPQREWVSLTDDEIYEVNKDLGKLGGSDAFRYARAIEAKLKGLNT